MLSQKQSIVFLSKSFNKNVKFLEENEKVPKLMQFVC